MCLSDCVCMHMFVCPYLSVCLKFVGSQTSCELYLCDGEGDDFRRILQLLYFFFLFSFLLF